MYKLTNDIKIFSFSMMIIGFFGLAYGFYTAPQSIEEAKEIIASQHNGDHSSEHYNDTNYDSSEKYGSHDSVKDHSYGNDEHSMSHDEHVYHQLSNRPWSALYVAAIFFFLISLGTLAFYAIQRASQAGWSPILFRVMEGITGYLLPGSIIVFVILVLCTMPVSYTHLTLPTKVEV